jgi:hypothetical protein
MRQYYILTKAHKAIWPGGTILFWGPDEKGYTTMVERAGKYSEAHALRIVATRDGKSDFMVPCEVVEAAAIQVVDIDRFDELTAPAAHAAPDAP